MKLLLILAVVLFVAVLWRVLASRRPALPALSEIAVDTTPDPPVGFGYKMIWLAVRGEEPESVVEALGGSGWQRANWRSGVAGAYAGARFVSPPVAGWVFVLDPDLPNLGGERDTERWGAFLNPLARSFSELRYFATHRVVDYHAWARFDGGELVRAYAYLGESGETLVDFGVPTEAEVELGLDFGKERAAAASDAAYGEDGETRSPSEEDVMSVAGRWSLDPTGLDDREGEFALGWLLVRTPGP